MTEASQRSIVVLGGTGFMGRLFAADFSSNPECELHYLVHRSKADWLTDASVNVVDIREGHLRSALGELSNCDVAINMLRPDGSGWCLDFLKTLLPALGQAGIKRLVHLSSIDIYNGSHAQFIDEESAPMPDSAYAQEHCQIEDLLRASSMALSVLRLGAVYGEGGRNVISFFNEAQAAPLWKLGLRRALYGRRRMHLVSVASVLSAVKHALVQTGKYSTLLVTDDDDERNNFAYMHERILHVCGRGNLDSVPQFPSFCLEMALKARGQSTVLPRRRFSTELLERAGIKRPDFATELDLYLEKLAFRGVQ
ncbi:NAD-dependent epimerase/dehydratase family protein [Brucella sp. LJL56]